MLYQSLKSIFLTHYDGLQSTIILELFFDLSFTGATLKRRIADSRHAWRNRYGEKGFAPSECPFADGLNARLDIHRG